MPISNPSGSSGGGGSLPSTWPPGGVLQGPFLTPQFTIDMATQQELNEAIAGVGSGGGGGSVRVSIIQDVRGLNESPEPGISGSWQIKEINQVTIDPTGEILLNNNLLTIPPGRYWAQVRQHFYGSGDSAVRLSNQVIWGWLPVVEAQCFAAPGTWAMAQGDSEIEILEGQNTFAIQYKIATGGTNALGKPQGDLWMGENYTQISLAKLT